MRGGHRKGAGRKKGVGNLLTQELREKINGLKVIQFMQDLVDGKIDGATINERKEAAAVLLKKILPDLNHNQTDVEGYKFVPLKFENWDGEEEYKDTTK